MRMKPCAPHNRLDCQNTRCLAAWAWQQSPEGRAYAARKAREAAATGPGGEGGNVTSSTVPAGSAT